MLSMLTSKIINYVLAFLLAAVSGMCVVLYLSITPGVGQECPAPPASVVTSADHTKRTTVVVTQPDGTRTSTTTRESNVDTTTASVPGRDASPYSAGVYLDPFNYRNVRADFGARLGTSPLEAVIGAGVRDNKWYMEGGLRVRF